MENPSIGRSGKPLHDDALHCRSKTYSPSRFAASLTGSLKLRLGSVRLIELERHVLDASRLGWRRDDDVVSALIPQFYFDFLRGGSPVPITGVVKHNQMDLRGLAALFSKITTLLSEPGAAGETESLDLFGLSRFLQRRGEADRAHSACSQALEIGLPAFAQRRELALWPASRRHGRAAEIWQEIAADPKTGSIIEQLAIHFEATPEPDRAAVRPACLASSGAGAALHAIPSRCSLHAAGAKSCIASPVAASAAGQRRLGKTACFSRSTGSGRPMPAPMSLFPCSSIQRRKSDGKFSRKTASYGRR
jgi:hypothetical protein